MKSQSNIQTTSLNELSIPFGKYKDIPILHIEDIPYLQWANNQKWIDKAIREAVDDRLNILQFTHI